MKTLTFALLLLLCSNFIFAQTVVPTITQYHPNLNYIQQGLNSSTSRYEQGNNVVSRDYNYLMNLVLVNKYTVVLLNKYKSSIKSQFQDTRSVDWSIESNVTSALNIINEYYTVKYIKDEILLLDNIKKEIYSIKMKDPNSFTSGDRYKELIKVMAELENIDPSKIAGLSLMHGIM